MPRIEDSGSSSFWQVFLSVINETLQLAVTWDYICIRDIDFRLHVHALLKY